MSVLIRSCFEILQYLHDLELKLVVKFCIELEPKLSAKTDHRIGLLAVLSSNLIGLSFKSFNCSEILSKNFWLLAESLRSFDFTQATSI